MNVKCVYCHRCDVHNEDCIVVRMARWDLATGDLVPGLDDLITDAIRNHDTP